MDTDKRVQLAPIASCDESKRLLLKTIPFLMSPMSALAQSPTVNPIAVKKLHSFGIRVSNVEASVRFYQQIFGAAIQARQGDTICLQIGSGPQFFSISPVHGNEAPGITYIGLSVEGFQLDSVQAQLSDFGISPGQVESGGGGLENASLSWQRIRYADTGGEATGTRELFFQDADGLNYQLCPEDHCGGGGRWGERCGMAEASSFEGLFQLTDLSHFTSFISNRDRANRFYTEAFAKQFQAYQGANFPIIGVGDGLQFVMYIGGSDIAAPTEAGRIDHVCFNMTNFSVAGILQKLTDFGLTAREDVSNTQPLMHWVSLRLPNRGGAEGGTPEVYFSDLDGIRIQLQDAGYCGGGGYLGDSCPAL